MSKRWQLSFAQALVCYFVDCITTSMLYKIFYFYPVISEHTMLKVYVLGKRKSCTDPMSSALLQVVEKKPIFITKKQTHIWVYCKVLHRSSIHTKQQSTSSSDLECLVVGLHIYIYNFKKYWWYYFPWLSEQMILNS